MGTALLVLLLLVLLLVAFGGPGAHDRRF